MPEPTSFADTVSIFVTRHDETKTFYLLEFVPKKGWWMPTKEVPYNEGLFQVAKRLQTEDGLKGVQIKGLIGTAYRRVKSQKCCNMILHASSSSGAGVGKNQRWVTMAEMNMMERNADDDMNDNNHLLDQTPQQLAGEYENGNNSIPVVPLSRFLDIYPSESLLKSLDDAQRTLLEQAGYLNSSTFASLHEYFYTATNPASKMNFPVFKTLFDSDQDRYWRAFSCGEKRLSFKNFIVGFAAADPSVPLEQVLPVRAEFLFRYYRNATCEVPPDQPESDYDHPCTVRPYLTIDEFREAINDLYGYGGNQDLINQKIKELEELLCNGSTFDNGVTLQAWEQVLALAGHNQVAQLVRLDTPLAAYIKPQSRGGDAFGNAHIPAEMRYGASSCAEGARKMKCPAPAANKNSHNANFSSNNSGPSDFQQSIKGGSSALDPNKAYTIERTVKTYHTSFPVEHISAKDKAPILPPGFGDCRSSNSNKDKAPE